MIPWNEIDTVLLDMDGTLLDLHFDNYFWHIHLPLRYAETHGLALDEAKHKLQAYIKAHEGTLNWYCLNHWSDFLAVDIRALKEEVKEKIRLRPFVAEFLERLRSLKKKLVLITNAHPQSLSLKLEVTGLDRWLDVIISSHQFQAPKEDQSFWRQLKLMLDFDPLRSVFIDDTERILESAQTFGIRHLLCVQQPDSLNSRPAVVHFPAIDHFDEILPALPTDVKQAVN